MEDGTNLMLTVIGAALIAAGMFFIARSILKIRKYGTVTGEIYDRRCMYQDAYFPVVKYEARGGTRDYTSTYRSVLQKIGGKMTLVYDETKDRVIGTMGELFFKPVTILLVGLFIVTVVLLYECLK